MEIEQAINVGDKEIDIEDQLEDSRGNEEFEGNL